MFVMFLFSGIFKESFELPFDLAGMFLFLVLLSVTWKFIKSPVLQKHWIVPIIFISTLTGLILFSGLANGLTTPFIDKSTKFVLVTVPAFLLPFLFANNRESFNKILISIGLLSVALSLFSLPMIFSGESLFVGFNNGNYQGLARTTGIGFIALFYFVATSKNLKKVWLIIALALVGFTLLATGSRMPLLALGFIAVYAVYKSFIVTKKDVLIKKKAVTSLFLLGVVSLFFIFSDASQYFQTIYYRFQVLFEGGGASVDTRWYRIEKAMEMFSDNLIIGGGFGNFGEYYFGDTGVYAHNMFFEFLSELGLIGALWFLSFLGLVLFRTAAVKVDGLQITFIACFVFFFLNAMVSGDINDNRALFSFASFLLVFPFVKERNEIKTFSKAA